MECWNVGFMVIEVRPRAQETTNTGRTVLLRIPKRKGRAARGQPGEHQGQEAGAARGTCRPEPLSHGKHG